MPLVSVDIAYEPLDADAKLDPGDRFRVMLNLRATAGELCLLFARSLTRILDGLANVNVVRIGDLGAAETFATERFRLEVWTAEPAQPFSTSPPMPNPKSFVKDFTNEGLVPGDVRPWLLRREPTIQGEAFRIWRTGASRRLAGCLANQVSGSSAEPMYHFSGPPARRITIAEGDLDALFSRFNEAAIWVYRDASDSETRHILLASEIARTWRESAGQDLGGGALDSARSAYEAYVRSGSKETLKALAELRKAVIDEAQKVAQRAQDLAGALWKDVAVATIPLALKVFPEGAKVGNAKAAGAAALFAAAFLVFSFCVQVNVNRRHLERLDESRQAWRRSLNAALSDEELNSISEKPLRNGIRDYNRVKAAVGVVYLILVFSLLAFSLSELEMK